MSTAPIESRIPSSGTTSDIDDAHIGRTIAHWRWWVITASLVLLVLAGVIAGGTVRALSLSRFEASGSESRQAAEILQQEFSTGSSNVTLLVTAKAGTVDDPAVAAAGRALTAEIAGDPRVAEVRSYWTSGSPLLTSGDRRHALLLLRLPGSATETRGILAELSPHLTRETALITVGVGGGDEVFRQVGAEAGRDFVRAEAIIFPGALVLLAILFRSLLAAALPIAVGVFAMVGTLATLRLIAGFTEVSTFALNLTLVLGLGLGIDYGLFVIARFREARRDGAPVADAVAISVATAGRTVVFSGVTVAVSLAAMLVFPFPFLRSFGYAGIGVVTFGVLGATVMLPALLAVFGHRIPPAPASRSGHNGLWHRTTLAVMRRPGLCGGAVLTVLLVLGSPFLGVNFGLPDDRMLPEGRSSRAVQEVIRQNFVAEEMDALHIVAPTADPARQGDAITRYAADLSRVNGIARVESSAGTFVSGEQVALPDASASRFLAEGATWLSATPTSARLERDPLGLVNEVRGLPAPFPILVGGYPADLADFRAMVLDHLPIVLALIFGATLVILFLMTGSVLLPIKATVMNLLSLSVMFGTLVFVFQEGHFSGLVGFTPTGSLETSIPVLMFCIAYGLSMDYEVFMLSRIKEEYDRTSNNVQAVAAGLERSGPLITAAALILALSFLTYLSSGVVLLKMLGLGTALAILVDATLIRAVLVPAVMRLAGDLNWWAPTPLKRIHARLGLSEH